jgi:hypothetical protein
MDVEVSDLSKVGARWINFGGSVTVDPKHINEFINQYCGMKKRFPRHSIPKRLAQ